jgi:hypothetical protein
MGLTPDVQPWMGQKWEIQCAKDEKKPVRGFCCFKNRKPFI